MRQRFLSCLSLSLLFLLAAGSVLRAEGFVFSDEKKTDSQPTLPTPAWCILIVAEPKEGRAVEILTALQSHPQLHAAVAWSQFHLNELKSQVGLLQQLKNSGQLECVASLRQAMPLPLIFNLEKAVAESEQKLALPRKKIAWPQDGSLAIAQAAIELKNVWGEMPAGFFPESGALSSDVCDFLQRQKLRWTIGSFSPASWPAGETLQWGLGRENLSSLQIFSMHPASELLHHAEWSRRLLPALEILPGPFSVLVYDQKNAAVSVDDLLRTLDQAVTARRLISPALPKDYATAQLGTTSSLKLRPYTWPWLKSVGSPKGPGLSAWVGDPQKNAAWDYLAQARETLQQYQNSGRATLETLDQAQQILLTLQNAQLFAEIGSTSTELSVEESTLSAQTWNEFRRTLKHFYEALNLAVPQELSAAEENSAAVVNSTATATPPALANNRALRTVKSSHGMTWSNEALAYSSTPTAIAAIESLAVRIVEEANATQQVAFKIAFQGPKIRGIQSCQIYIDVNHRPSQGEVELLGGRGITLPSEDGWEYAIRCNGPGTAGGVCELLEAKTHQAIYRASPRWTAGKILQFKIPREILGQNPMRWGFWAGIVAGDSWLDVLSGVAEKNDWLTQAQKPSDSVAQKIEFPMLRNGDE